MKAQEISDRILRIENGFDQNALDLSESFAWPELIPLFSRLSEKQWARSLEESKAIFDRSVSLTPIERAFILQWPISITEVIYDLECRTRWMARWDEIKGWAQHPYCLYLHAFQDGLSAFYNGALREADARFKSALEFAINAGYPRGQIQAHFHLGLVAFDRVDYNIANECFAAAQEIALAQSATRFLERIAIQKARIESDSESLPTLETLKRKIESMIITGRFLDAQQTLTEADTIRRQERLHPQRESLYFYQPLIFWGLGKPKQAERAFRKINDPILRAHVLILKERTLGLSLIETAELFSLKRTHGLREDIYRSPLSIDHSEVCGIKIGEIQNANIRSLIQLFLTEKGPLTKERIAEAIWTRAYNPLVDDKKVYQLIYNARAFFRKPDLFRNRYGFYELNLR